MSKKKHSSRRIDPTEINDKTRLCMIVPTRVRLFTRPVHPRLSRAVRYRPHHFALSHRHYYSIQISLAIIIFYFHHERAPTTCRHFVTAATANGLTYANVFHLIVDHFSFSPAIMNTKFFSGFSPAYTTTACACDYVHLEFTRLRPANM